MSAERDRNACRKGSLHLVCRKTWRSIQDTFYKSKASSRFPNFDVSNSWQMGHDSPEGIFLGQELLLDFAAWLDLTSNVDNTITSYLRSFRTHFDSLKRADDLRVYQDFMMPLNHQAGTQGTLTQCLRY